MVKMNANDIVNSYNKATSSTKVSTGNKKVDSIVSAYNVAKTQPAPKITTAKVSKPVAPKKLVATPTPPLTGIKKVQQTGTDIFTSAQNTAKKIGKDLQVTFVKATQPPQNIKDIQKLEKKPLIINPNQKKLNSTQLQQLNGTEANSAQLTAKAKQTNVGKVVSGKISKANEDLGPVLARAYVPQQYLDPKNPFSGRFNPAIKPTAGKIIGGAIDDFFMATLPVAGSPIKAGRDILKEGPNVLSALKSGTLFSAAGALVSKLKEEEVTFKQSLINFGLGALIGMGEPTIQVGAKNIDIIGAKKTLSDYGIKASDFKNPEALKNKFRDTVKKLHPDKGGNQDEFIQFTDAFNKVTSAGVDSSWKLPDIGLWVKSLWKKKPSEAEIIKTAENVKTKLEKLQDKNKSPIEPGTYTPEQVTGMVISSGQSKTPEGMELLKSAIEARQAGQNIMIEKPVGQVNKLDLKNIDKTTSAKIEALNQKDIKNPVKEGQVRVYQVIEKGHSTPYVFKNPEELANYQNGRTSPTEEFRYIDAKPSQIEAVHGKPTVFKIKSDVNSEETQSLLNSDMAKEAEAEIQKPKVDKAKAEIQKIEEDIQMRRQDNEAKKSILEQFTGDQIKSMRIIKTSMESRENKGKDATTVEQLPTYQKNIHDVMSAIGTNSTDEALRFIREDLPEPLVNASTRAELGQIKVLKSHITPKQATAPKAQLPVGEGKLKASKLEARVKGVMGKVTEAQIEDLGVSTYQEMNKKETIAKAAEYVTQNPQEALDVIRGKIEAPKGLIPEAIYIALTEHAIGDLTLGTKLASLQATALGQRISILSELNKDSAVKVLNEVYKIRAEEFKKTHGNKSAKEVVKAYTKKAKFEPPKLSDWGSLIKEVRC